MMLRLPLQMVIFDTTTFTLTVNPINDAPTFITSSIGTVDENQNFN